MTPRRIRLRMLKTLLDRYSWPAWQINEGIQEPLSITTTALSHVTKLIKLPTTALLAYALKECIKLKELTLPMNLVCLIQIICNHFSLNVFL